MLMKNEHKYETFYWWHRPVVLVTQETEARESKVHKTVSK